MVYIAKKSTVIPTTIREGVLLSKFLIVGGGAAETLGFERLFESGDGFVP